MKSWKRCVSVPLAFLVLGTTAVSAVAQPPGSVLPQADMYLRTEMRNRDIPGLAVAVVRDSQILATQTYGLANIELNVPVTLDTVFPIASLDKQLTSAGIMLLVKDGRIHLDDEIGQYFVDPPPNWKGIRVGHLLSHSSGLPDEVNATVEGRDFTTYTTDQLLENIKQRSLLFPPGTAYQYSDAGLFLAQLITEKASGKAWRQFIAERVFAPAGMTSTVYMDPSPIIKNRVSGYELTNDGKIVSNRRTAVDFGPLYNDVGATVIDFAHWALALEANRVVPQASRDLMWTSKTHANDAFYWRDYGYGWGLDRYRGVRVVLHSGFTGVAIVILPEQQLSVLVFTNLDNRFGADAQGLALGVAGFYYPDISLLAMTATADPNPVRTELVRSALAQLARGEPDYSRYVRSLFPSIQESVIAFSTRAPHIGEFQSLVFLSEEQQEGEKLLYYRADFSKGRLFLRISFDSVGKISCFQIVHL